MTSVRNINENRRARFDYHIESDLEVGIILEGSEIKSLRAGGSNIADSYASVEGGELWLINGYIAPYAQAASYQRHDERRKRKLLVSKRELSRLWNATQREGMTLVPLSLYFNEKGRAKLKLGVAKGKNKADKRETSARRDWDRQKARILKDSSRA
jgi:SsrA-binding protein